MKNKYKSSANIVASRLIACSVNADELKNTPLCAIRSENHDVVRKHNGRKEKSNLYRSSLAAVIQGALLFLGTAAIALPHAAFAESGVGDSAHAQPYNISAGPLEEALNNFVRQTRVKLSFAAADVKDITTQGLNGNFSVQGGLNRLLIGSGLEAVPQANGYIVRKLPATVADQPAALPPINVSASTITSPTDGYMATKSFSATRTDTPLRDVPQSITVVTQEMIKDQTMLSIGDVVRYVPGVNPSQGEGNRDTVIFRGSSSTGDFYVDGLRDDVQYFRDLYNVDRVEVLKGSNGMIFGRGGAGGVINRVIKEAGWTPIREITAQYGSFSHKRIAVDIGQAINDVAAFRLNAMYEHSNSYRNGVDLERGGVNPTFTFKPTAQTKVVLSGEYFFDRRTADRGIPSFMGRPANTDRSTFFGNAENSPTNVDAWSLNSLIEHRFDNNLKVRNRTRYASYDKFYQNVFAGSAASAEDATGTVAISAYNNATQRQNLFTQTDFLYNLDTWGVKHEFMTGVEYGRQVSDNFRNSGVISPLNNRVSFLNPTFLGPVSFSQSSTDANNHGVVEVVGIYLQDQITLLPQLKAVLGIRYDNFDANFVNNRNGQRIHTNDGLVSPRVGLIYKPIEEVSIYGNYSLAYVPRAGDQLSSLTLSNAALKPESFMNLELGAKWDIRPDLSLTTALYQLDRSNVITQDPNDLSRTNLVDGQRARGAEIGLMGRITPQWSVMGGYAYTDAEISKALVTTSGSTTPAGSVVAQVPKHTVSVWNRYDFTPFIGLGLGVIHRSSMYAAVDNTVLLPGFTRLDTAVFVRLNKTLRVQANIENIANVNYVASANSNNNITPGAPRIFRLTVVANF
ncbi:TonB-dependent siderophore receptor [Nitrosospira sp. NRS527]|uniref:TonB-dependent siderophore receptor n=1 Tax=Nitrosospira sp. NRS527 TaxID=155925 RepID=UPI001AF97AB9|nr:TonB-dependent siderophore receptor [Nitrosospira sp. NRS527]BCT67947.1 Metal-pseudopaline receptor CntO [Nitrosospira sp. NRS527]